MRSPYRSHSVLKQVQECARDFGDSTAFVSLNLACQHARAESIVAFSKGEQPAVARDLRAMEFQLDAPVPSKPLLC
jgi:hypothetical protein